AQVVGNAVAVVAFLAHLDDRVAAATLAGWTVARTLAFAAAHRTVPDHLAIRRAAAERPAVGAAEIALLEGRRDDAVAAAPGEEGERLHRRAGEAGGRSVEKEIDRAARRRAERAHVAQEIARRLVGRQGRLARPTEDHRIGADQVEGEEIAGEAARTAAVDRARIEEQRVLAGGDRAACAVRGRVAADDVLVLDGNATQ